MAIAVAFDQVLLAALLGFTERLEQIRGTDQQQAVPWNLMVQFVMRANSEDCMDSEYIAERMVCDAVAEFKGLHHLEANEAGLKLSDMGRLLVESYSLYPEHEQIVESVWDDFKSELSAGVEAVPMKQDIRQIIAEACRKVDSADASAIDEIHFEHVLGACAGLKEICESASLGMVILAMDVWREALPYAAISFGIRQLGQEKFEELLKSKGWHFWGDLESGHCGAMPQKQYEELVHANYYGS